MTLELPEATFSEVATAAAVATLLVLAAVAAASTNAFRGFIAAAMLLCGGWCLDLVGTEAAAAPRSQPPQFPKPLPVSLMDETKYVDGWVRVTQEAVAAHERFVRVAGAEETKSPPHQPLHPFATFCLMFGTLMAVVRGVQLGFKRW